LLFDSLAFSIFFAVVLALYIPAPQPIQNRLLLAASYLFYAAWDWRFLGLLLFSTVTDWGLALRMAGSDERGRRLLLLCSVMVNLGLLGAFKYWNFFLGSLRALLTRVGVGMPDFVFEVILPVGISFYTFQSLSYTVDVYRGRLAPTRNLVDFALFVSFFPQLVAGPIERAERLLPQIASPRRLSWARAGSGTALALWGLYKKVVIADNLAPLVGEVFAPGAVPTGAEVLVAAYAFAAQIYCDFSGYSDIARGTARILGFDLMLNFDRPYWASRPSEFWRRWHISLSSWLRDYLYIPLGGGRGPKWLICRNLIITMLLGGLWHGAAWTYAIWGGYHGVILCLERWLFPAARDTPRPSLGRAAGAFVTFQLMCLGLVIFRSGSVSQAARLLAVVVTNPTPGLAPAWLPTLALLLAPLLLFEILQVGMREQEPLIRISTPARALAYSFLMAGIILLGEDGGPPFIYFQF